MSVTVFVKWEGTGSAMKAVTEVVGVGATVALGSYYTYLGDGDGFDTATATFLTPEGVLLTRAIAREGGATIDASEAIKAAAEVAKVAGKAIERAEKLTKDAANKATSAAKTIDRGATVKVTAKRAKGSGTVGIVRWIGPDKFKRGASRLGLEVEGAKELFFTAESNVTVIAGNEVALEVAEELAFEAEVAAAAAFEAAAAAKVAAGEAFAGQAPRAVALVA